MEIMRLSPTDVEKALPLYREMFELKAHLLPKGVQFQDNLALDNLKGRAQNGAVFAVEHEDEILGAVIGQLMTYPYSQGHFVNLQFFYVRPKARGNNVARALLEALIQWTKAVGALELNAGWDHMVSRKDQVGLAILYRSLGFKDQGKLYSLEVN